MSVPPSKESGNWPERCSEVMFEMADESYGSSAADARIGDLVWQPKGGDGHLLVGEGEPRQYGWEEPWTVPVCECGDVDLEDHHVVLLARKDRPE